MIKKEDRVYFESLFPFWESLTLEEQNYFIINSRSMTFTKGMDIRESPECLGFSIIKSGNIRVYLSSKEGKELTLFFLKEKDIGILTTQCVKEKLLSSVVLETKAATEVIIMNPEAFQKMRQRNALIDHFATDLLYTRVNRIIEEMEHTLFVPLSQRLLSFLLEQGESEIYMTQEEIAGHLGSAREVITRNLKLLQKKEWIEVARGRIKITNALAMQEAMQEERKQC